eukprot:s24_g38.t1
MNQMHKVLQMLRSCGSSQEVEVVRVDPPEDLMDFLRRNNLEKYASNICNHENASYSDVKMLMEMQPEDLMAVAIDCRFANEDRKKLGDLVTEVLRAALAAPSIRGKLFNALQVVEGFRVEKKNGLQLAYLPFKKTQVQDYMYSFGEKIEPKEHRCLLRVMEAQIPSAYVEENIVKEIMVLVLGQTGGGKSTQIDGMLNFLLGIKWEEGIRFKVVDELQTVSKSSLQAGGAASQTDAVTAYKIPAVKAAQ